MFPCQSPPLLFLVVEKSSSYYSKEGSTSEIFFVAMSLKTFLVDLRVEELRHSQAIVSDFLAHHIETTLAANKMVVLLLNRRGHARTLLCHDCGEILKCRHCDVSMTVHKQGYENFFLLCHYCGLRQDIPQSCPACGKSGLKSSGVGIQQAEEELRQRFPGKNLVRMDADTMRGKDAYHDLHEMLKGDGVDILLGTQMLAKGLDNPRVTLVGVLDADIGLSIPDFRAEERTFQLLMQVLGRAGRQGDDSAVVVQTWMPDAPSISFATQQDMEGFYEYMLEQRKTYLYPPFGEIIKLSLRAKTPEEAELEASATARKLEETALRLGKEEDINVLHAPAYIARQQGAYVHHVFIKGKEPRRVLDETALPRGVRIDVDPVNLL